ncbi:MAG: MBL fold metallo-hydrolase [Candidatus Micrarchaeia archaeon]
MKLIFLGTGGGRINLAKQFRSTAGFLISGSKSIYVDPGAGVVNQSNKYHIPLSNIDILFVSHPHLDHANDAELLVEVMTHATLVKRGIIVADHFSLKGSGLADRILATITGPLSSAFPKVFKKTKITNPAISEYHQDLVQKVYEIHPGLEIEPIEGVKFRGTHTKHDDPAVGFVLEMDGKRIGYTSDTEYFEGMAEEYANCDVIIINMLRATKPDFAGHLYSETVAKFLKEAKPKKAFITRFGGQFFKLNPGMIAKKIQDESGVPTIATRDGMSIEI